MSTSLKVALAQINTTVGDVAGNAARASRAIAEARSAGADVVVLPEATLPGYPPEDLLLKPSFVAAGWAALEALAADVRGITALVGVIESDRGRLHNAAALVTDGRAEIVHRKHALPNYGVFDEARYFAPGIESTPVSIRDVPVGVTICEDIWVEDGPGDALAARGARVILNLSASPYAVGKPAERERLFTALARRARCHVLVTNLVGGQDELVFDGTSLQIGPDGAVWARGASFEEEMLVVDVPVGLGSTPIAPDTPVREPLSGVAETYAALTLGTRDYVRKNGFERVVIGLSGGIDSALTAAIAVDALGPEAVTGVYMPSRFSSDESEADARELATRLGIEWRVIPIGPVYDAFLEVLAEPFAGTPFGIAEENIQARIRGGILMALSNKFGWLVLTTGNKSETAVGYSTLYGDTAGGFAVLKDLYKTGVYAHARVRNERGAVIPERVLTKPPSAELRPDQKDEDSLPPYEELDPILEAYVERDRSVAEIVAHGHEQALVEEIIRLVDQAEYKRRQSPPGVKITPRAFGKDRRVPITSAWRVGRR
jgi:NAD+ synthase (glutamine-hydrolysing)